jgi:ABC-type polar amino acid transport system ATPase subunit
MPALSFHAVAKYFGQNKVLDGITLDVATGEKLVICGPSGSGKSTLLRTINGLETYDEGTIVVEGTNVRGRASLAVIRQKVGMVFQQFNLFPHLTVLENCTLAPRRRQKVSQASAEKKARDWLARVHLQDFADRYPSQLSGGQQQRVAIARCLCLEPSILLFDEPTSALDPEMVGEVLDVMQDLAREGRTMLCVTHEMGFAREVADCILFMDAGKIVEKAAPEVFFTTPQHPRAKEFLAKIL